MRESSWCLACTSSRSAPPSLFRSVPPPSFFLLQTLLGYTTMASTARSSGPLRLVPGAGSPEEVATCLMVASALGVPVTLSKATSLSGTPAISSPEGETASWALLTPEGGSIASLYAACLYLASTKEGEGKSQGANGGEKRENYWEVEDALAWAAFPFRAALRGVNRTALLKQLDFLEGSLGQSRLSCSSRVLLSLRCGVLLSRTYEVVLRGALFCGVFFERLHEVVAFLQAACLHTSEYSLAVLH